MKLLSGISGKIIVIAFVVIVVVLIALVVLFTPYPTTVDVPVIPVSAPNVVSIDNPITAENYPYVGVSAADTLVADNEKDKVLVINLDHRKWQQPAWSPNGKLIAVLGESNPASATAIYDLYVYTLATNNWKQLTFFGKGALGITGYAWKDDSTLVFSQGAGTDNWVHTFNLQSGETKKIFQVNGRLSSYISANGLFQITTSPDASGQSSEIGIRMYKVDGTNVRSFSSGDFGSGLKLISVYQGRSENEWLFELINGDNRSFYSWSFNDPVFRLQSLTKQVLGAAITTTSPTAVTTTAAPVALNFSLLCSRDSQNFWGYTYSTPAEGYDLLNISLANATDKASYSVTQRVDNQAATVIDKQHVYCGSKTLIPVKITAPAGIITKWYAIQDDKLVELKKLEGFSQVVIK